MKNRVDGVGPPQEGITSHRGRPVLGIGPRAGMRRTPRRVWRRFWVGWTGIDLDAQGRKPALNRRVQPGGASRRKGPSPRGGSQVAPSSTPFEQAPDPPQRDPDRQRTGAPPAPPRRGAAPPRPHGPSAHRPERNVPWPSPSATDQPADDAAHEERCHLPRTLKIPRSL